jgi:hypothetical protein
VYGKIGCGCNIHLSSATQNKKGKTYELENMPLSHKIATVISCLAVLLWLISKVKPDLFPFDPTYPAIAVFTLCEAVVYWNKKCIWACLLFAAAVISLGCFILELMLQL